MIPTAGSIYTPSCKSPERNGDGDADGSWSGAATAVTGVNGTSDELTEIRAIEIEEGKRKWRKLSKLQSQYLISFSRTLVVERKGFLESIRCQLLFALTM